MVRNNSGRTRRLVGDREYLKQVSDVSNARGMISYGVLSVASI